MRIPIPTDEPLFSPAKVNLFFQVVGKRSDGYHEIVSMYQAINVGDFLYFSPNRRDLLTSNDPTLPLDQTNLVHKALHLFRKRCPHLPYFHVHMEKHIPQGAGLGGASSNAATTLWKVNEYLERPLSEKELIALGATLGADVPFFFSSGLAYCSGKGEVIEDQPQEFPFNAHLALSKYCLSTPLVYGNVYPNHYSKKPLTPKRFFQKPAFFNDLEQAAFATEPRLLQEKRRLAALGFQQVSMSGSGSAYFCLGPPKNRTARFFPKIYGIRRGAFWYKNREKQPENRPI